MKRYFDILLVEMILPSILNFYERFLMYRIREAWGIAHKRRIPSTGSNVRMVGYSRILDPEGLIIGNNVRIGYGCFFFSKGGIEIGDNTILSRNITIYSSNHDYNGEAIPYGAKYIHEPVKIGKGVWIGMNVTITPGVSIGDGAIIGMGTVVSRNVEPGAIVVGAPQRHASSRNMEAFRDKERDGQVFSKLYPLS